MLTSSCAGHRDLHGAGLCRRAGRAGGAAALFLAHHHVKSFAVRADFPAHPQGELAFGPGHCRFDARCNEEQFNLLTSLVAGFFSG